jgi:hypothetical protein
MSTLRWSLVVLALLIGLGQAWADEKYFVVTPKIDVTVTGTATLVAVENTFRMALSCTNNHASVHVRWGDSAVTATTGQRLPAGTSIEIKARGAVYMISEGANVTVSCTEEAL